MEKREEEKRFKENLEEDEFEEEYDDDNDEKNEQWEDWEEENATQEDTYKCLLCSKTFFNSIDMLNHMKESHSFNFLKAIDDLKLSFYDSMKMVNYIRELANKTDKGLENFSINDSASFLNEDKYLKPFLEYDPFLFDLDEILENNSEMKAETMTNEQLRILQLERQLEELENKYKNYVALVEESFKNANMDPESMREDVASDKSDVNKNYVEEMNSYFQSYSSYPIHEEMLKDEVRTNAYGNFITKNSAKFDGKNVLDVGCGTSILSMFSAKSRAKKVFAVDASSIANQAQLILRENELHNSVSIIKGKIEEVQIEEKVDIIVSEWMGYFLLYESMLDSVLYARDNYLCPGGIVYPSRCTMYLIGLEDKEIIQQKIDFWGNVYGFKMNCMKEMVYEEAIVQKMNPEFISTNEFPIKTIDVNKISKEELEFESNFELKAIKDHTCNVLTGYFDTDFDPNSPLNIHFSTGLQYEPTHWHQTSFLLKNPLQLKVGQSLKGSISVKKGSTNERDLDLAITYWINEQNVYKQNFHLR